MPVCHAIERTSPKGPGQKFIGTCRLCGTKGLTMGDALMPCPNPRGLTSDEALIEAIDPDPGPIDMGEAP
jgi:hypothetical protein